jgi:ribosomal protein S12 methylthiotransferase
MARLKKIRNMVIRTTVIVGFPSESDNEFSELMEFVATGYIDWLGVFPYYHEPGTNAAKLDQLPDDLIAARYRKATAIQQKLVRQRNQEREGDVCKVLVHAREDEFIGHAEFAAPEIDSQVFVKDNTLELGKYYDVRITATRDHDLQGELAYERNGVR